MAVSFARCELQTRVDGRRLRAGLRLGLTILLAGNALVAMAGRNHTTMRGVEGEVIAVGRRIGEGDLDLMQVRLQPSHGGEPIHLLVAPAEVCEQIEFTIEPGDRIRARVFMDDTHTYRVQKIHNLSRGIMVRLRTLHEIPLWDEHGMWQGGPIRSSSGQHRHGRNRQQGGPWR